MRQKTYIFFDFAGTLVKMRPARLLTPRSMLLKLSDKYLLGIITGAKRIETINILRKLKVEDLFDIVVTKDDTPFKKPNPSILPRVSIKAYTGDTLKDKLLAKNAGLPFYRVNKKCKITKIISLLLK